MATERSTRHVALVTGASRGLGLEFVRQLLERDDRVFACARTPDESVGLLGLRQHHGDRLSLVQLDVGDAVSIDALHATVAARTDHLDLLINNAGINSSGVAERQRNLHLGALEAEVLVNPGWVRTDMGGPRAELTAEASVAGLLQVAASLHPSDAGTFRQWDGSALAF